MKEDILTGVAIGIGGIEAATTIAAVLTGKQALMPFIQFLINYLGVFSLIPIFFLRAVLVLLSPIELRIALIIYWGWWSWRNML